MSTPPPTHPRPQVIALEEHYFDPELSKLFDGYEAQPKMGPRLLDLDHERIRLMDEAGVDIQVLSHAAPATHRLDGATAVPIARRVNDRLRETIARHPSRFAGFATLPAADPQAAADELERAVVELGMKGAMVHGLTQGLFIDDKRFWPIFERAQALDVPIYIHPSRPNPVVIDAYYKDYVKEFPSITNAGWGFGVETATQAVRLVLSRVFETYPKLKIICGHLGEGLPFLLWRIDMTMSRSGNSPLYFRETFREHFWLTTSGNFSHSALLCTVMEMGIDRILFGIDYPYVENAPGTAWMQEVPLCTEDREKILNGNAKRLLRM
ncbi:MAG: amidohydrolase [Proteobacteria bacterium]|nr:amidohydrolase [Burkholderiales bacterium]